MKTWIEDGNKMVSYTSQELKEKRARGESQTDWAKVDAMTDDELDAIIAKDPDDFTPTDEELARAYRPNLGEKPPSERNRH